MITKRDLYEIHSEKICPYTGMTSPEFAPLSAGISYRDPYYHIRRFNGDHYVFECVLQGTGYVEFNGTLTRLTAGDAYILHPCTFHHYYSDHNDPWVKIWFNGQGNLISHLLSDYQLGFNCCVRNFWKSDYLMQILQKLEKEPSLNKNELALLLHQHIIQFSEQLNGLQTDTSAPPDHENLHRAESDCTAQHRRYRCTGTSFQFPCDSSV